jgi:hypothetical protein
MICLTPVEIKQMFKCYNNSKLFAQSDALVITPQFCRGPSRVASGIITKNKIDINVPYVMKVVAQSFGDSEPYLYLGCNYTKTFIGHELREYFCEVLSEICNTSIDIGILYRNNVKQVKVAVYSITFIPLQTIPLQTIPSSESSIILTDDCTRSLIINDNDFLLNELSGDNAIISMSPGNYFYDVIKISRAVSIISNHCAVKITANTIIIALEDNTELAQVIFSNIIINGALILFECLNKNHILEFDTCYLPQSAFKQNSSGRMRIKNCYIESDTSDIITINNGSLEIFYSVIISNSNKCCIKINDNGKLIILNNTLLENDADDASVLLHINQTYNLSKVKYCAFKFNKRQSVDNIERVAIISYCDLYIENSNFYLSGGKYIANMNNRVLTFKNNCIKMDEL